jgi:hypothetical protein
MNKNNDVMDTPPRTDFYYTICKDGQARIQYYNAMRGNWSIRYKKETPIEWEEIVKEK